MKSQARPPKQPVTKPRNRLENTPTGKVYQKHQGPGSYSRPFGGPSTFLPAVHSGKSPLPEASGLLLGGASLR
jgi:hypothetical protein